ncbi:MULTISPECIES: nucleoside 2-deoxyribosyltransferase [Paenibacillus]|uniref:nucleoside 2-deoxyribosyltransferase n=1 Tax=Paenibacillus TaxID=44249 RepID=UPI0015EB4350|nr:MULTISPECIES: nucleoside 2-deoxyribosyltransferase domain-containing protein [Paenibacillus]
MHKNVYLSGSILTSGERRKLERLNTIMEAHFLTTHLPHRDIETQSVDSKSRDEMFKFAVKAIEECDMFVAVINNDLNLSNTCWEIGYAYAHKKPIFCLHEGEFNINQWGQLMLMNSSVVCHNVEELTGQLNLTLQK